MSAVTDSGQREGVFESFDRVEISIYSQLSARCECVQIHASFEPLEEIYFILSVTDDVCWSRRQCMQRQLVAAEDHPECAIAAGELDGPP